MSRTSAFNLAQTVRFSRPRGRSSVDRELFSLSCAVCEIAIPRRPGGGKQRTYCSETCRKRAQRARYTPEQLERERENTRRWREANPERHKAHNRKAYNRYRPANLEKRAAQQAVLRAIRRGDLTRPETCPSCGREGRIEAHHQDYSKPLEVIWLCRPCHSAEHRMAA